MHTLKSVFTALCAASIFCAQAQKTFKNPVYNQDTPDPTVVRAPDGTFYAYGTGGTCRKSTNLYTWTNVGNALSRPTWNDTTYVDANGQKKTDYYSLWALDVSRTIDDKYLVYYACALWGNGTRTGIGVATGTKPTSFTDRGRMFRSTEIGVTNSIDPCYVEEFDKKYLVWGSFHDLYISELTDDGLAIKNFSKKTKIAGGAFEGAMIYKRGSYYYLFASVGSCCEGVNSTYRTVVGRSTSITGPYTNKQGGSMVSNNYTTILKGNDSWKGPGHNSEIITDDAGQDWLLYHAYSSATPDKGRVLMLDKITWDTSGWPTVGNGTPSTTEQEAPIFYSGNGANVTYKFKNTDLSKSAWKGWNLNSTGSSEVTSGKGTAFMPMALAQGGAHFDAAQTVSGLKNGIYELRFNGFSTGGSSEAYLNQLSTPVNNPLDEGTTPSTPEKLLAYQIQRNFYAQSAYGIVSDGKLTIGVRTRNPLLKDERFCMANLRIIYREKDSLAQKIVGQNIKQKTEELAASNHTFYREYTTRIHEYLAEAEAAEDSLTSYDYLLKSYLTLDSIQSNILLYDSLRNSAADMQEKVDAAAAQGYASEEAKNTLAEALEVLSSASYSDSQMEDLLARIALALYNMEYSYQQGDGTQDNPYVIMRPAQLDHMHNVLIKDEMVYFVLGADIDMTGYNWKQLNSADNTYRYRINLDGRGHIISNLTPDGSKHNPSFFGVLCGECRNVGFLNARVESTMSTGAILCGYMGHSTFKDAEGNLLPVVVENCYFEGTVSGKGYLGAIGGTLNYSPVTIRNCYSNVQILGTSTIGNYAGGLAGRIRTEVHLERSYAAGNVIAYTAGGIIGGGQNSTTPACIYDNVIAWNDSVTGNSASPLGSIAEEDTLREVLYSSDMIVNGEAIEGGNTDDELRQHAASWGAPWHADPTAGNGYPILEWQYQRGDYRQKCGFPMSDGIISAPSSQHQGNQATYDLQGRRIQSPTKGLYIINGHKVLVK